MYEIARRLGKKHEIHVLTRRFKGLPSHGVHEGVHIHRVFVPSAGIKLESPADGSAFMAAPCRDSSRFLTFLDGIDCLIAK